MLRWPLRRCYCLAQFPSAKLHRKKRGDCKNIAGNVSCTHASVSGRRKSRLEQIPHLLRVGWSRPAQIELFNRLERGKSLRRNVMHGIQIFKREQGEKNRDQQGSDRGRLFAHRRKGEQTADDNDVKIPVRLHGVGALEIKLNKFVVVHRLCTSAIITIRFIEARRNSRIDKGALKTMLELRQSSDDFGPNNNGWARSPDDRLRFFGVARLATHN